MFGILPLTDATWYYDTFHLCRQHYSTLYCSADRSYNCSRAAYYKFLIHCTPFTETYECMLQPILPLLQANKESANENHSLVRSSVLDFQMQSSRVDAAFIPRTAPEISSARSDDKNLFNLSRTFVPVSLWTSATNCKTHFSMLMVMYH
jgi:hypothetical protein